MIILTSYNLSDPALSALEIKTTLEMKRKTAKNISYDDPLLDSILGNVL